MKKQTTRSKQDTNSQAIAPSNYETHIHELVTVDTLPGLCSCLAHINFRDGLEDAVPFNTPSGSEENNNNTEQSTMRMLPSNTDLHFFRAGRKPTWEDPANQGGGRFIVRVRKGLAPRMFEWLLLGLASGGAKRGDWGEQVVGVVWSSRHHEDLLAIWCTKLITESDFAAGAVRERLRQTLQLPPHHPIDYKPHDDCKGKK